VNDPRPAVKVGIAALLSIAGLIAAWSFLAHQDWNTFPLQVRFEDTQGLQLQAPVRMSGVKIGEVKAIELDLENHMPLVTLRIENRYRNAIPEDSRIEIRTGLLVSNPQIEIVPGTSSRAMVPGRTYSGAPPKTLLAQVSPETDQALRRMTSLLEEMTPSLRRSMSRVEGILQRTEKVVTDLGVVTGRVRRIASDPQLERTVRTVLRDLEAMSRETRRAAATVSAELQGVVKRNAGRADELMTGLLDLLQKFTDAVDSVRGLVVTLAEQVNDPRLQQSLQETLDLVRSTVARFNQVAADVHALLGDTEVQGSLRETLVSVREAAEHGKKIAADISTLTERLNLPRGGPKLGLGTPQLSLDMGLRGHQPHFRSNVEVRLPVGRENGLNLGIYDFAETNRLTAQYEAPLSLGRFRYGIYGGKLGVGLDTGPRSEVGLRLDAWNPNDPQMDLRAFFRLNDAFSLWVGAEGFPKRTTPSMGLRLHK